MRASKALGGDTSDYREPVAANDRRASTAISDPVTSLGVDDDLANLENAVQGV